MEDGSRADPATMWTGVKVTKLSLLYLESFAFVKSLLVIFAPHINWRLFETPWSTYLELNIFLSNMRFYDFKLAISDCEAYCASLLEERGVFRGTCWSISVLHFRLVLNLVSCWGCILFECQVDLHRKSDTAEFFWLNHLENLVPIGFCCVTVLCF